MCDIERILVELADTKKYIDYEGQINLIRVDSTWHWIWGNIIDYPEEFHKVIKSTREFKTIGDAFQYVLDTCQKPKLKYKEYILSEAWAEKAEKARELAGYRCQLCYSDEELHAHHRTYKRLGYEPLSDITILCSDCHAKFHDKIP